MQGSGLTDRLHSLGVTSAYLRGATERIDNLRSPLVPKRRTLYSDDPADVLVRLLFCRIATPAVEAEGALGGSLFDELIDCGVVEGEFAATESRLERRLQPGLAAPQSRFHLRTVGGLYLFSDYLGEDTEAVMGAGETTAILYRAARPRGRVGRVFDLGCGAGSLALLLALDADEVVGSDINSRAIELARFNAVINGIGNAEFRVGSLYEPVRGERFDLLVSQPPYYPREANIAGMTFLHGGERGDELARQVVAGALDHIEREGRGLVFTSWALGAPPVEGPDMRSLELRTGRGEVTSTWQSLNVIEHAGENPAWSENLEIAPQVWDELSAARIDEHFAARDLLAAGDAVMLRARFALPEGARFVREGAQVLLEAEALGLTPVDDRTVRAMEAVCAALDARSAGLDAGGVELVRAALRKGWLRIR